VFILPASHSPKTRRKKLNARMKSFSLDTPEPPKQLLGIDESTKKKSSSFTNTCFGGNGHFRTIFTGGLGRTTLMGPTSFFTELFIYGLMNIP